jgi:AcrR family transcriptional regulator
MSSEMSKPRPYELKQRAERQRETRRRIVEAAVELHQSLGPAATTVTAVAERAGVTRPTVYAHFPDARSLLEACSGHVRATVPPPDPTPWRSISDPGERLETALRDLYRYYERLEPLLENVQRDAAAMPVVAEMNAYRVRYLEEILGLLLQAWPTRGAAGVRLRRAIGHALDFRTWQSLIRRQGCTNGEAVQLMRTFVSAAEPAAPDRCGGAAVGDGSGRSPSRR